MRFIDSIDPIIDFSVLCFFVISGFFFKIDRDGVGFFVKQVRRLLYPYVVFSAIYALTFIFLRKAEVNSIQDAAVFTFTQNPGMQLYFLPALFLVSTAANCFALLATKKDKHQLKAAHAAASAGVFLALFYILGEERVKGQGCAMILLYLSAFMVGNTLPRIQASLPVRLIIILGALASLFFFSPLLELAFCVVTVSTVVAIGQSLALPPLPGSGAVYLLHTPLVNFTISTGLHKIGVTEVSNLFISVALTYATCIVLYLLLTKVAPSSARFLLEGEQRSRPS